MLVKIERYKLGGFIFKPVNQGTVKQFHKDMIENGCNPNHCQPNLLLHQEDIEPLGLSRAQLRDMDEGWTVTIRIDTWTVRQYFGYCDN